MSVKSGLLLCTLAFLLQQAFGQELQAKVSVSGARLPTSVDRRVFQALQAGLSDFINNRKWTSDNYQSNEKIECSFLLTLTSSPDVDTYTATLVDRKSVV